MNEHYLVSRQCDQSRRKWSFYNSSRRISRLGASGGEGCSFGKLVRSYCQPQNAAKSPSLSVFVFNRQETLGYPPKEKTTVVRVAFFVTKPSFIWIDCTALAPQDTLEQVSKRLCLGIAMLESHPISSVLDESKSHY